ncbi:MAG: biotin transporter BioY [Spirochaetaceae bacterium]|jgi:biotin transport system substrate-specific component|nr:biotin transporter BioY [Spirochaetaceae bacterium]
MNAGDNHKITSNRKKLISLCLTSLFAALIACGTFISIPLPVSPIPVVLQNMFALLSGLVLGPARGAAAVALYLLAGAIGIPVFAGGTGGIVHFQGPSGGFLAGYLLSGALAGFIAGTPKPEKPAPLVRIILAALAGMLVVYVPGVARLKMVLNMSWTAAFAAGFIPFIVGDIIKCAVAVFAAVKLRKTVAKVFEH